MSCDQSTVMGAVFLIISTESTTEQPRLLLARTKYLAVPTTGIETLFPVNSTGLKLGSTDHSISWALLFTSIIIVSLQVEVSAIRSKVTGGEKTTEILLSSTQVSTPFGTTTVTL